MANDTKNLGVCFVSSYPPRKCGIATFTLAIKKHILRINPDIKVKIAAINDTGEKYQYSKRVIVEIAQEKEETYINAAKVINQDKEIDIINLQHVFSLFGGENGDLIIHFLENLKKPVITTMHMIYSALDKPHQLEVVDRNYRTLTEKIASLSAKIVVITQPMADLLTTQYHISEQKVVVIPHGAPEIKIEERDAQKYKKILGFEGKKVISTYGLIRPKKGLEYLIQAMPQITKKYPDTVLVILGECHPNRPRQYYEFLKEEARKIGLLDKTIFFNSHYLTFKEIISYLLATDVFVAPYLVTEQTSSGVIAFALGCGKAIISTPFIYAKEVLGGERGMFVKYKDSESIFQAVDFLFSHQSELKKMGEVAYNFAQTILWKEVARLYLNLFNQILKNLPPKLIAKD